MVVDTYVNIEIKNLRGHAVKMNNNHQGLRNGFHPGVAHNNSDFEKVDFQKKKIID